MEFEIKIEFGLRPIKWARASGRGVNRGTGPPFDHTTFSPSGHYLYLDSSLGDPDSEAAIVKGPNINCFNNCPSKPCVVYHWHHMYARTDEQLGTLKLVAM